MELGIYAIKRNMDYFKVDEEFSFMDFLQTGTEEDVIKNTLYSLAVYNLPMDAVELYSIGFFDTSTGFISLLSSFSDELAENDNVIPYFDKTSLISDVVKVLINMKPYEKTYEYFVEEVKRINEQKKHISDDV